MVNYTASTTFLEKAERVGNCAIVPTGLTSFGLLAAGFSAPYAIPGYLACVYTARKITQTAIGYATYPAATVFYQTVQDLAEIQIKKLGEQFSVEKIQIWKSGIKYSGYTIKHIETKDNGKWFLNVLGRDDVVETFIYNIAMENFGFNANTLLLNGPSVAESGGWPTRYQMHAGVDGALEYLEKGVLATHIVIKGFSLGGPMTLEACAVHTFDNSIKYLVASDRTFDSLSKTADKLVCRAAGPIIWLMGADLESSTGSKVLSEKGIRHMIIQHTESDGVIPASASLANRLKKDHQLNRTYLESSQITHSGALPEDLGQQYATEIKEFFA